MLKIMQITGSLRIICITEETVKHVTSICLTIPDKTDLINVCRNYDYTNKNINLSVVSDILIIRFI